MAERGEDLEKEGGSSSGSESPEPSALGCKDHWDAVYDRELDNFDHHGDVGEVWFGEVWERRVLKWLRSEKVPADARVLDLGSGNGSLLKALAEAGFTSLSGVDYSAGAVALGRRVLADFPAVHLAVADVLDWSTLSALPSLPHDVLLDKGTWDAISLREDSQSALGGYVDSARRLLRPGGSLVLLSCNFTRDELLGRFGEGWEPRGEIAGAQISFGGRKGNTVAGLVLTRL